MTDKELMQQALDALEDACGGRCNAENNPCWQRSVANALRDRLAQPEQEIVECSCPAKDMPFGRCCKASKIIAWINYNAATGRETIDRDCHSELASTPLYTTPPQRKPLTHPQIHELDWPDGVSFDDILSFVRAIEAAHGIKP